KWTTLTFKLLPYIIDDPDLHIIDGVETIYEEDLESFEIKSVCDLNK
ncbi:42_t:CDS:1, partial [Cetraspora pellucida]